MNRETRNVEAEVRKQFERLDPETKPTIFIGFSGGLDSLALLVALVSVGVQAAPDSDAEAALRCEQA